MLWNVIEVQLLNLPSETFPVDQRLLGLVIWELIIDTRMINLLSWVHGLSEESTDRVHGRQLALTVNVFDSKEKENCDDEINAWYHLRAKGVVVLFEFTEQKLDCDDRCERARDGYESCSDSSRVLLNVIWD